MTGKQERALRVADSFLGLFRSIERILDLPDVDATERAVYERVLDELDVFVSIRKVETMARQEGE